MTSIPALPPLTPALSKAVGAENNPRVLTNGPDFQSHLKAQSQPALLPPVSATAQVLAESTADISRRPGVEALRQLLASRAESCGGDFTADVPCKGGLNAAAIAVALSGSTLIWIPFETVRAPLQSPRLQILRRRKPASAEGVTPDQADADVDNSHG